MIRRIVLSVVSLCLAAAAFAQNVTVTLTDAATGEPVGFATVSLTRDGAKSPAVYALSNSEGKAVLEKVRSGKYTLKAELMGYKAHSQEVEVKGAMDLGTVRMEVDQEVLDAASVSAAGIPIVIKKDTVEYNASSFKISDNDVLENLLKKLPGVEVAEDGSITANGETITKITIDGKTFFLDDPQLASKNIPANIVEKVKVVKKKSEQAEFTGISDGEEETVIDLSVRKGMMNGLFGNVMAGGGHDLPQGGVDGDWRYQGAAMVARFSDKSQVSVIANANNTNNRGFNDLAGSMMTSMRGGGGGMGRGAGGFGGTGNGITTSYMAGVNGNVDLFDDKMQLGGNYLFNGTRRSVIEDSYKETYLDDGSTLEYTNDGTSSTNSYGHRFGIQLDHKFSDNTSILFRPQFNFGRGDYNEFSEFSTVTADATGAEHRTNEGFTNTFGDNRSMQTNGMFLFRQRLGLPGRTLSFNFNWNISDNTLDGYNQSLTQTFGDLPEVTAVNQRIDRYSKARSLTGRLVYTEPIGGDFYVEGSYQLGWNRSESEKKTYDSGDDTIYADGRLAYATAGETLNGTYSNSILNRYVNQSAGLALMYQRAGLTGQVGLSANPTRTHNETNGKSYDSNVVNWAPRAMLFYDINDNTNLRFFYFGRSSQPSTTQLMPVMDNSDPLAMSLGNPYLLPYFNHNGRLEFGLTNKETFFTLRANLNAGMVQKPIVNAVWYDPIGVQYSFPVNGDNSYSANLRLMVNSPISRSDFSVMSNTNIAYSSSNSYVGAARLDMSRYFDAAGEFLYEDFHRDYEDLDASADFTHNFTRTLTATERLRLTYRIDDLELTAGGRTRVSKPWYTITASSSHATWNNQLSGSVNWTVFQTGLELTADVNYNWYRGYTTPQDDQVVLNASISKLIFHNQATLALKAYDILNQAKNLTVTDASNYHQEVYNNTLGRYIIVSLTWRFGNFGKARQQMNQRFGGGPGGGPRF